jgi:nanoRNase/pAp phosphatase (c-di-AMP/oligoRNAs hydrolase)
VSLRSKAAVKVGYVMRALGGGGHDHAAGATLNGDPLPQLQAILSELEKALAEQVDSSGATAAPRRG